MYPHDRQRPPTEPDIDLETHQPQRFSPDREDPVILQLFDRALGSLKNLPKEGQVVIVLTTLVLGFSLITTLFKLINLIITLAFLGGFGYIGYKFILASNVRDSEP